MGERKPRWPRKFKTYWCVTDGRGTAYLVSARVRRSSSIDAFIRDAGKPRKGWPWWRRIGYSCQRVEIKVRSAPLSRQGGVKP